MEICIRQLYQVSGDYRGYQAVGKRKVSGGYIGVSGGYTDFFKASSRPAPLGSCKNKYWGSKV